MNAKANLLRNTINYGVFKSFIGTKRKSTSGYRDLPIIRRSNRWNSHRKITHFLKNQIQNGPVFHGKVDESAGGVTFQQVDQLSKYQSFHW